MTSKGAIACAVFLLLGVLGGGGLEAWSHKTTEKACAAEPEKKPEAKPERRVVNNWSQETRDSVMEQCLDQIKDKAYCWCFTQELEVTSPDPTTEVTAAEMREAVKVCGVPPGFKVRPEGTSL